MYLFFCLTNWTSLYSTYTNVDCVDGPVKVHNVNDKLCTTVVIEAMFDEIQIGLTQNRNVLQESN